MRDEVTRNPAHVRINSSPGLVSIALNKSQIMIKNKPQVQKIFQVAFVSAIICRCDDGGLRYRTFLEFGDRSTSLASEHRTRAVRSWL